MLNNTPNSRPLTAIAKHPEQANSNIMTLCSLNAGLISVNDRPHKHKLIMANIQVLNSLMSSDKLRHWHSNNSQEFLGDKLNRSDESDLLIISVT